MATIIRTGGGGASANLTLPPQIRNFAATAGNAKVALSWQIPELTDDYEGLVITRKVGSYPSKVSDGVKITLSNAATSYEDTGLTNDTTYYYRAFPFNAKGQYQTELSGAGVNGTPRATVIYGVSIDLTNSNPATAVTYTDGAVGMTGGSATWDTMPIFKDIKPCVLKNGVVQYYLNPADLSKKADGTSADITSGNDGDVMIEIPKMGFKITTVGDTLTVQVTDAPSDVNFKYYAHTRSTEGDRDSLYIGAYLGYETGSKLRSLSGKTPTGNKTISAFRTLAQANGAGYDQVSFYPLTLLQSLFMIKYKHLNSQVALGRGYVDGNSAAIATGGTNAKGIDFGESTGKMQMCFLNIEDMWGNIRWYIDGFFSDASRNMLTAFTGFNDTGAGYTNRGQGATANIGKYMSKPQGTTEAGFVAKEVTGSETTHFADYALLYPSRVPTFGGCWTDASRAGVFCLYVDRDATSPYESLGARLMYL